MGSGIFLKQELVGFFFGGELQTFKLVIKTFRGSNFNFVAFKLFLIKLSAVSKPFKLQT
jgi:hypothetical protein